MIGWMHEDRLGTGEPSSAGGLWKYDIAACHVAAVAGPAYECLRRTRSTCGGSCFLWALKIFEMHDRLRMSRVRPDFVALLRAFML